MWGILSSIDESESLSTYIFSLLLKSRFASQWINNCFGWRSRSKWNIRIRSFISIYSIFMGVSQISLGFYRDKINVRFPFNFGKLLFLNIAKVLHWTKPATNRFHGVHFSKHKKCRYYEPLLWKKVLMKLDLFNKTFENKMQYFPVKFNIHHRVQEYWQRPYRILSSAKGVVVIFFEPGRSGGWERHAR